MKTIIQNIDVNKIYPHPDNPRKDLGDLTELVASIKARGILQNLTVVLKDVVFEKHSAAGKSEMIEAPIDATYTVVIGHRRLAAAKLAGLTEVPCVISQMDHKDQVATMLLENIQRSDLTPIEQAQGFQMMLDLGETVSGISEKTGLSESTVRHRVKLTELDQDRFKKSVERGATLSDYMELEKIEDPDLKNRILETIGTPNFKWELQRAIDKEKNDKAIASMIEQLQTFAEKIENSIGKSYVTTYNANNYEEFQKPEDADAKKYYYFVSNNWISLYCDQIKSDIQDSSVNAEQEQRRLRIATLKEAAERAYKLRYEFALSITTTKARKNMDIIAEYIIKGMLDDSWGLDYSDFAKAFNIENEGENDLEFSDFTEQIYMQPERSLFVSIWHTMDSPRQGYCSSNGRYEKNENLDAVYEFLERLGYELSDEEEKLRNGTHELYLSETGE
ncbi:MAG TPA: ParB/RepB/Spo0J family partition protein [Bacillota bacterium]|nr:ParB/RepB/Spo0J family partition protein [Bacillota bacterium]